MSPRLRKQHGAVLIFTLLMLLLLSMLMISGMSNATLGLKMSHNHQSRQLAFEAAESALKEAEKTLLESDEAPSQGSCPTIPPLQSCYEIKHLTLTRPLEVDSSSPALKVSRITARATDNQGRSGVTLQSHFQNRIAAAAPQHYGVGIHNSHGLRAFKAGANKLLWQFSAKNDPAVGRIHGRAVAATVRDASGRPRPALISGNGKGSSSGSAVLYILFIDAELSDGWTRGDDYQLIDTQNSGDHFDNGLSTPAVVDIDGDGIADRAYAGDLYGNLWAFDISRPNKHSAYHSAHTPRPLFYTQNADLAVVAKPTVSTNPDRLSTAHISPNLLVFFGSGGHTGTQYLYGIWDNGRSHLTRHDLIQQDFSATQNADHSLRLGGTRPLNYLTYDYGWLLPLPEKGERIITAPQLLPGDGEILLLANSHLHRSQSKKDNGWFIFVNALSGGRAERPPFKLQQRHEAAGNDAGAVKINNIALSAPEIEQKSIHIRSRNGNGRSFKLNRAAYFEGRLSWREIRHE